MAPHRHLRETAERLQSDLASGEPLDAEDRSALERILAEVVELLDRSEETTEDDESLAEQLRESANDFEESHPSLTHVVGLVVDALSRLGI